MTAYFKDNYLDLPTLLGKMQHIQNFPLLTHSISLQSRCTFKFLIYNLYSS